MNIDETMSFIGSFSKSGKPVRDLSRAEELMRRIGNPEKQLKFVHIAGTNGKGSTVEYISNALILSGYRTGQFTSPFIRRYNDRIRINGAEIDDASLCEIADIVRQKADSPDYSQFEITMAIALLWFLREKCDVVVFECGIGGALDCTNIIPPPLLAVITSISLDHTAILGDTVEEIAKQKAGIIKKGSVTVLSADNNKSLSKIIRKTAERKGSFFVQPVQSCIKICDTLSTTHFSYKQSFRTHRYRLSMAGVCQVYNAVTAIEACFWLKTRYGFGISQKHIERAVETTAIKCRMQYIYSADMPTVLVDGGHNPAGINNLALELAGWKEIGKKLYIIMGMVDTKDFEYGVSRISALAEKMFCVDDFAANSVAAGRIAEIAEDHTEAEICGSLTEAVENAESLAAENNGLIVVCGSLYLASKYLNDCDNQ
ncbi:MAG: bifunctional folylpolyglutamate synthase/dihydrofolate synthase [Ruminococcus sp.]|nr:bifunctional folylpolyglutamate synthase/dihydrofolate synthase [Ruminococcus sp.]